MTSSKYQELMATLDHLEDQGYDVLESDPEDIYRDCLSDDRTWEEVDRRELNQAIRDWQERNS